MDEVRIRIMSPTIALAGFGLVYATAPTPCSVVWVRLLNTWVIFGIILGIKVVWTCGVKFGNLEYFSWVGRMGTVLF